MASLRNSCLLTFSPLILRRLFVNKLARAEKDLSASVEEAWIQRYFLTRIIKLGNFAWFFFQYWSQRVVVAITDCLCSMVRVNSERGGTGCSQWMCLLDTLHCFVWIPKGKIQTKQRKILEPSRNFEVSHCNLVL